MKQRMAASVLKICEEDQISHSTSFTRHPSPQKISPSPHRQMPANPGRDVCALCSALAPPPVRIRASQAGSISNVSPPSSAIPGYAQCSGTTQAFELLEIWRMLNGSFKCYITGKRPAQEIFMAPFTHVSTSRLGCPAKIPSRRQVPAFDGSREHILAAWRPCCDQMLDVIAVSAAGGKHQAR